MVWDPSKTSKIEYLSISEMQQLIQHLKINLNADYTSRFMILTALYTGMRIGEIMALNWDDINFFKRTISITKSWALCTQRNEETKDAKFNSHNSCF